MLGQVAGRFGLGLLREESKAAQSRLATASSLFSGICNNARKTKGMKRIGA
jgi:hypothetical protein